MIDIGITIYRSRLITEYKVSVELWTRSNVKGLNWFTLIYTVDKQQLVIESLVRT